MMLSWLVGTIFGVDTGYKLTGPKLVSAVAAALSAAVTTAAAGYVLSGLSGGYLADTLMSNFKWGGGLGAVVGLGLAFHLEEEDPE